MKISCKNEFNSLVTSFCTLVNFSNGSIKTSRAKELLSHAFGYKSANGLLASLPVDLRTTEGVANKLGELLKKRHEIDGISPLPLLRRLDQRYMSESTRQEADRDCYPTKLPSCTHYWYLTQEGWVPWEEMDFTKMRAELNIYKVVSAFSSGPLAQGEPPFVRFARPIWTANLASHEFESEADELARKYGELPESDRLYPS